MENNFFADYLERLMNLHMQVEKAVQDLPAEALDWVPGSEMNSVAVLLAHTAGSLRFWIGDVAAGEPSGRVREREFRTREAGGTELLTRLSAVVEYARTVLSRMALEDLDQECIPQPGAKPVTRGWALLHALEHAYQHLGHMELTAQLWRQQHA